MSKLKRLYITVICWMLSGTFASEHRIYHALVPPPPSSLSSSSNALRRAASHAAITKPMGVFRNAGMKSICDTNLPNENPINGHNGIHKLDVSHDIDKNSPIELRRSVSCPSLAATGGKSIETTSSKAEPITYGNWTRTSTKSDLTIFESRRPKNLISGIGADSSENTDTKRLRAKFTRSNAWEILPDDPFSPKYGRRSMSNPSNQRNPFVPHTRRKPLRSLTRNLSIPSITMSRFANLRGTSGNKVYEVDHQHTESDQEYGTRVSDVSEFKIGSSSSSSSSKKVPNKTSYKTSFLPAFGQWDVNSEASEVVPAEDVKSDTYRDEIPAGDAKSDTYMDESRDESEARVFEVQTRSHCKSISGVSSVIVQKRSDLDQDSMYSFGNINTLGNQ